MFFYLTIHVYIIEKYFSNFTKLILKRFSYNLRNLLFQILKIFKIVFILFLFASIF